MSKKIYGPRQSQSKTGLYDLKNAVYTPTARRGRPEKDPRKLLETLRQAKVRVSQNSDEYDLLNMYTEDLKDGSYGSVAKASYNQILYDLERSKNPNKEYGDLLKLIKVVKEESEQKIDTPDFDLAVYKQFPDYVYEPDPNLVFHSGREYNEQQNPKVVNVQNRLMDQMKAKRYDKTIGGRDVSDIKHTYVPEIDQAGPLVTRGPQRKVLPRPPAEKPTQPSLTNPTIPFKRAPVPYRPPEPPVELPTQVSFANMLKNFPVPLDEIKTPASFTARPYIDADKPTKDMLVKSGKRSSSSKDPYVEPLVPDDLQNLEALQYEQNYGVGVRDTYGVYDEQKHMFETREERDIRRQLQSYQDEAQMLGNRPNSAFRGADIYDKDDMDTLNEEGYAAGGAELKKPYKPDIFNNMNPQAPVGQTAKGRIGLPKQPSTQRIYPTISGVGLPNYNRPQQRPIRPEGISGNDNVAQDRRVQIIDNDRLGMRVTRTFADLSAQQNALTNVGGGIMSQIANNLRQSADSGEEKKDEDNGLYGAEGGMFNNQDVSNPRTLDQRFSRLGQQRMTKNFKINKYVNLKNKNKQTYDTVTAPSLKEIRARTLGYVQPNSKVKGNSVELIRQSNATQMKLNNMFMP